LTQIVDRLKYQNDDNNESLREKSMSKERAAKKFKFKGVFKKRRKINFNEIIIL